MANQRHTTTIDVDLSTAAAEQALARLQGMVDALNAALGAGRGAGGGGGAPGAGGGAPTPPPGGGGGSGGPAPAPAPSPAPGGSPGGGGSGGGGGAPTPPPGAGGGGGPTPPPGGGGPSPSPPPGGSPGGGGRGPSDEEKENKRKLRVGQVGGAAAGYAGVKYVGALQSTASQAEQADMSAAGNASLTSPFELASQHARIAGTRSAAEVTAVGQTATAATATALGMFSNSAMVGAYAAGNAATALLAAKEEQKAAEEAAALDAASASINFRMGIVSRRASYDQQAGMLGRLGGRTSPGAGVGLGLSPEESMSAMMSFGQSAGFTRRGFEEGAFDGQRVLNMSRSGASLGAAGSYRGLMARGAGGFGNADPEGMIGLAQSQGLAGSKVDDYLQRITSATSAMAEQGLKLNLPSTEMFLRRLAHSGVSGLNSARATANLIGAASSARDVIAGPYQDVVKNSVLMESYRAGGGAEGAARAYEGLMQDPDNIRGAVNRNANPEVARMAFWAQKMSLDDAGAMQGLGAEGPEHAMRYAGGSKLGVARARNDARILNMVGPDDAKYFKAKGDQEERVMKLAEEAFPFLEKIDKKMGELNKKVIEALGKL